MAQAKVKKKFWKVSIPLIRKETDLYSYSLEDIDGRYIKYDLTRLLRGKSVMLQVKVVVKGDEATTIPKGIQLMPYYVKRLVRKGTNYVEDSFQTNSKDSRVIVKPFLVTRRKVSRAVRKALREKAREELIQYIGERSIEEVFQDILRGSLQKTLSMKLKKIYPLSVCEIRNIKVKETSETKQVLEEMPREDEKKETKEVKGEDSEKSEPKEEVVEEKVEEKKVKTKVVKKKETKKE